MYKGSYIAKLNVKFHIDPEKEQGIMNFDEIKSMIDGAGFDKLIRDAVQARIDSIGRLATVELIREKAELHEE